MEKSDAYEDKKTVCGERLEHAFDFMEAAFANGQELVIFVTGLNNRGSQCGIFKGIQL